MNFKSNKTILEYIYMHYGKMNQMNILDIDVNKLIKKLKIGNTENELDDKMGELRITPIGVIENKQLIQLIVYDYH